MTMHFGVLGSLEVRDSDGTLIDVGGRRQRQLLAALIVHAGSVVSDDRLTEMVWSESVPPEGGVRALRTVLSRLRTALHDAGADRLILTKPPGYLLARGAFDTDADEFERHASAGVRLLGAGETERAVQSIDAGLALWRGAAYAEFVDDEWARIESARLEELRAVAHEVRVEAMIISGAHREAIAELDGLVATYPFREQFRLQLITALYRSGRQTEALRHCQEYRDVLADELGLEPSVAMRELELQILNHAPELAATPAGHPRIKSYELAEKIGAGAWGVVWRARQPSVDRDVAIKVIDPEISNDPEFIRRFEVEARIVAGLEHPHILPVYDYWRDPSGAYLVTRLMRGGSAGDRLASHGRWDVATVAAVVEQIGSALMVAHRAGVIHRDVKPSNILLDIDDNAILSDFGIAVHGAGVGSTHSTGSIGYAAPEQLAGVQVGPSSDVFGLAVTAWELLSGSRPAALRPTSSCVDGEQCWLPALHPIRPEISAQVDVPLRRATQVDPADRYADVGEFVDAFTVAAGATPRSYAPGSPQVRHKPESAFRRSLTNPYKGLRPFDIADSLDFFGRDDLIRQMLDTVSGSRFAAAVGPSGAGKSSLVSAGVLPALRRGDLPGAERWFMTTMVPGSNPFEELEAALLRVAVDPPASLAEQLDSGPDGIRRAIGRTVEADSHLVIVIDQFEELYTQCHSDVADRFIEGVSTAVSEPVGSRSPHVIVTLRADFFDRPLSDPRLAPLFNTHTVAVGAMTPEAMALAITGPAARAGVVIESALINDVMRDAEGQPAVLPLVQYMLTELFEQRDGPVLTQEAYRSLGGLRGVVAQRAEEIFGDLGADGHAATRRIFGRLVSVGDGVPDTRRRARTSELQSDEDAAAAVSEAIERFGQGRLLVFDRDAATREPTVEIAHEALLVTWPRLRGWLDEDRNVLRSVAHISHASKAWEANARDAGDLLRGARLAEAVAIDESSPERLTGAEREFVASSRIAFEADQTRQHQQRRRLRTALLVTAVLLVVAAIAGAVALRQSNRAEATAYEAQTRRLVAESARLVSTQPDTAMLLALEARRREQSIDTLGALQRVYAHKPHASLGFMWIDSVFDVAFLPDGRLVTAGKHELAVWDLSTREKLWSSAGAFAVVAASHVGDIVIGATDHGYTTFDADSGARLDARALAVGEALTAAAISPDGSVLALGTDEGRLIIVELDGERVDVLDAEPLGVPVESIAFDNHSRKLAFAAPFQAGAVLWDLDSMRRIGSRLLPSGGGDSAGAGPGGVLFVDDVLWVASDYLRPFDASTGEPLGTPTDLRWEFQSEVDEVALGKVGNELFLVASEGAVAVNIASGAVRQLPIEPRFKLGIAIDAERATVARATPEGVDLWALDGVGTGVVASVQRASARVMPDLPVGVAHLSSDGSTLVSSLPTPFGPESEAGIGDIRDLRQGGALVGGVDQAFDTGLRVAGNTVIRVIPESPAPGAAARLAVWNPTTGLFDEFSRFQPANAFNYAFAADDRFVAAGWDNGTVDVFDRATRRLLRHLAPPLPQGYFPEGYVSDIVFSPDGRRMIMATMLDGVAVYDTTSWVPEMLIEPTSRTNAAAGGGFQHVVFTPDGGYVVTFSGFRGLEIRDPDSLAVLRSASAVLTTPTRFLGRSLDISADGSVIEVETPDGPRLYDFESLSPIGDPYPHDVYSPLGPAATYAHDVDWLATSVGDDVVVLDVDPDMWESNACLLAGRNLSRAEWEQYGFTEPYHQTCPQWGEYTTTPETTVAPTTVAPTIVAPTTIAATTGTYVTSDFHPLDPETDSDVRLTFAVPAGWSDNGWYVDKLGSVPSFGVVFDQVANIYTDSCPSVQVNPPIGPTVDDLASAWANLPGFNATAPSDITVDGFHGKQVEFTVRDYDEGDCPYGWFKLLHATGGGDWWAQGPNQHNRVWILDVNGTRLVIVAVNFPDTSLQDRATIDEILASIEID
jgi:serine/threonine protein kinase/DNA-binding SARP family transcriptional activator/WD40 repeat protein